MRLPALLLLTALLCGAALSGADSLVRVQTQRTEIVLNVADGRLHCLYFGDRLREAGDLLGKSQLSWPFSIGAARQTHGFPTFGTMSNNPDAARVTHADGNLSLDLAVVGVEQTPDADGVATTVVSLKDPAYPFFVQLTYRAYLQEDVIAVHATYRHEEPGPVVLHYAPSTFLPLKADRYWLTSFSSAWGSETRVQEEPLGPGSRALENTLGTHVTWDANPSFFLSLDAPPAEESGRVIAGTLAWSGSWRIGFQVSPDRTLGVTAGIHPVATEYHLAPGEAFSTPALVLTQSSSGTGEASRRLHRWARRAGLAGGERERLVLLNNWEGTYFDFNEAKLEEIISDAAAIGGELFVLDDGWFGNKHPRNSDKAGLGDWEANRAKLPRGIDHLIDVCEAKGLKFGLWVEPEMVNPRSELYEQHPDWVIHQPNRERHLERDQLMLDLSRPEVREFVYQSVHRLLQAHPRIAYIKWDANRDIQNPGSAAPAGGRQAHLWIEYARALEQVAARLRAAHPNVVFQLCASGGGRVTYGLLPYFDEYWTSDNTDARDRLQIQWGTSYVFPALGMAAHVSAVPNHQTGRVTPIKFRFDVAMTGRLGLELQPSQMTPAEREFARQAVATYKRIRPLVQFGDLYRILPPTDGRRVASLMYVAADRNRAVFFGYRLESRIGESNPRFLFRGLDPQQRYRVTEINTGGTKSRLAEDGRDYGGDMLMQAGLPLPLVKEYDSMVLLLEAAR